MQSAANENSFHYTRALFLSAVREVCACEDGAHREFIFAAWTVKYTVLCVKIPVFASILVKSNLGLKWKQTAEKENV